MSVILALGTTLTTCSDHCWLLRAVGRFLQSTKTFIKLLKFFSQLVVLLL